MPSPGHNTDWHRHHRPPAGHKYSIGVAVAVIGRPVARLLNDGYTLEVTRVATDGTRNTCSMLYAAAWTAVKALGYRRLVTYTQAGVLSRTAGCCSQWGWWSICRQPTRRELLRTAGMFGPIPGPGEPDCARS